jgi:hypothetical protein
MNVIRGDHVIQHTEAKAFSGIKKPIDPRLTITSKLQQKLPLVTAMRQVPNLPNQIKPVGSGHTGVLFLKAPYSGQKNGFKARIRPLIPTICKRISCFAWSDPILEQ